MQGHEAHEKKPQNLECPEEKILEEVVEMFEGFTEIERMDELKQEHIHGIFYLLQHREDISATKKIYRLPRIEESLKKYLVVKNPENKQLKPGASFDSFDEYFLPENVLNSLPLWQYYEGLKANYDEHFLPEIKKAVEEERKKMEIKKRERKDVLINDLMAQIEEKDELEEGISIILQSELEQDDKKQITKECIEREITHIDENLEAERKIEKLIEMRNQLIKIPEAITRGHALIAAEVHQIIRTRIEENIQIAYTRITIESGSTDEKNKKIRRLYDTYTDDVDFTNLVWFMLLDEEEL